MTYTLAYSHVWVLRPFPLSMALKETQQVLEAIKRSTRPLVCVPAGGGHDAYATALGLAHVLKKLGKEVTIVAADGPTPKPLHFLPGHDKVRPTIENLRHFIIELDVSKAKVKELSYEVKDDKMFIHVSPTSGTWDQKDSRVTNSGYKHDLIMCIGAPDLESCAEMYRQHPDFFFSTPIINIDHKAENEHYGQLNVVDLTATSCGEVCHDLFEAIDMSLIDDEAATAFLTGMIAKTKSFKRANVTPKTLQTAGKLVAKGARREEIVQHLYRTRSVQTLRLWGRALARLKQDAHTPIVWSLLSRQDFLHAGAGEEDLGDVTEELITSSPDARIVILFHEGEDKTVHALVHAERPFDALLLSAAFKPTGSREDAHVVFPNANIVKTEQLFLEDIRRRVNSRI